MPTRKRADKFPLWLHPSGQWAKKCRGQFHYFGTDKDEALKRYVAEWPDITAGRTPRPRSGDLTVADGVNHFLSEKRNRVDAGELTAAMWGEYHHAAGRIIATFTRTRRVADLRPDDFGRLRAAAAKRLGPASLGKFVTMTRTLFAFLYKSELIDVPVKFGASFDKPSKRVLRLDRVRNGPKLIDADACRKLLAAADPQLRAMILLGLNCAFGATDCSNLERRHLDVRPGWIDWARIKTGTPRRCPLWPETVAALDAAALVRPDAKDPADAGAVFLTRHFNRWTRFKDTGEGRGVLVDSVLGQFQTLARKCGVKLPAGCGFYVLRHTFRTVADGVKDQPAAMAIMGHADQSINSYYRESIDDSRLLAVTDHVRRWLLTERPG
jgi:integrase